MRPWESRPRPRPPSRPRPTTRDALSSLRPPAGPQGAAWAGGLAPPVPFALLEEQGPDLGWGSRRWCRAALGETDRQGVKEDPPTELHREGGGSAWVLPPAPPAWSRPYSLGRGDVEEQAAGSGSEPRGLIFMVCSTPPLLAPPRNAPSP